MRKKLLAVVAFAIAATFTVATPAYAAEIPAIPAANISDQANILSPGAEEKIENEIEKIQSQTNHEVAVLTVTDLGGETIEDYSLKVANAWGVGSSEENDGVLLVVAMDERALRIEVGSGIRGLLTDSKAENIIDNTISPLMREGNYEEAVLSGVTAIGSSLVPAPSLTQAEMLQMERDLASTLNFIFAVITSVIALIIIIAISVSMVRSHRRKVFEAEQARLKLEKLEREREANRLHQIWLASPEGKVHQKREAEKRRRAAERYRKEREATAKIQKERQKRQAETAKDAKKVYSSLDKATINRIKTAPKSKRKALLSEELRKTRNNGATFNSSDDSAIIAALLLYSVFSTSDYSSSGSSSSSYFSSSGSSSSYSSGGSSYDGGSSFSGGSFDGGGGSGGW